MFLDESLLRSYEQPLIEADVELWDDRDIAGVIHRLIGNQKLRDEVTAGWIDGVSNGGERPAAAKKHALPAGALFRRPALRASGQPPQVSLEGDLS